MHAEQTRLRKRLDVLAPSVAKDYFRNAPLLDFMAPTIKVQQIILPNVVDDVNFIRVPKMDRCQTCHLAIDKKGYEKYPQPFTTHPESVDRISAATRRIRSTGSAARCATRAWGSRSASATRRTCRATRSRRKSGRRSTTGKQPHLWDYPMLPTKMTEASCAKCHKQQVYVPKADNAERRLRAPTSAPAATPATRPRASTRDMRKPGPILTKIDSKLTPDWVKNWIRNPRAVKPTTWMPRFWYNSNNSSPEDAVRNEAEINAIVAYLFANSGEARVRRQEPAARRREGGEKIVKSIGCQGCHVVGEGHARGSRPAPDVRPAAREHRQQDDLRVDLQLGARSEALQPGDLHAEPAPDRCAGGRRGDLSDDAEGAGGDAAKATPDQKAVDDVLLDYFKAVMPFEDAKAQLAKLDATARSRSSWASAPSAATAASAATTSRASRRRSRSAPTCPRRAASWSRGSTSRSSATSRTRRRSGGSARKLHDPRDLRQGPRAAAAREAADAELRLSATRRSSGCSRRS